MRRILGGSFCKEGKSIPIVGRHKSNLPLYEIVRLPLLPIPKGKIALGFQYLTKYFSKGVDF